MSRPRNAERAPGTPVSADKRAIRALWAGGDYHRFARQLLWEVGPVVVRAAGIGPGHRVLDVAAGTGNVAIPAAAAGARVVASDLTPEHFEAGRREAAAQGLEIEWVEADAEALPFAAGAFDIVTSAFGAMFAPDQQRVADEMARVCQPGGTIAMANFPPDGLAAELFEVLAAHAPPAAGSPSPLLWGDEAHVRSLFGAQVRSLEVAPRQYVERAADTQAYVALYSEAFGPLVAIRAGLAGDPDRLVALDHDLLDFATRSNRGAPDGPVEYPYEYLLVIARTQGPTGA
jgi:ubiquinone/menaquinone biosynthesis C-methylase UbiE